MRYQTLKALLLTIAIVFPIIGESSDGLKPKPSVLKSTLIPGWGEHSYDAHSRGYLFNGIEAALWIFAGFASSTATNHENDLYYFASEYGQIANPQDKSDVYLDRVSKYNSMDEYNEQMLRNRQWDRLYSAENGYYWEWESEAKRGEYFDIKTQRYLWRQRLTYTFGAIALNHLVSTMDALYLKRLNTSMTVQPQINDGSAGLRIALTF
ncbi:MAG: hypothetical protein HOD43_11630 [Candidatus Marinimicrobia bacterium]|nr:hypothetical protein [Candidatus Neomarinimicrobiota bacterium]MBT3630834.1 hypothetical protein [Candidatus Neomarinimicrobiota bacterium]MBT3825208.1 hypothetical protein [Candidatus Neomarinimicrobiota bacterium]MBT4132560.1 hypothetical protein [Candidatus Neomarinimicrobiota bacterium]MBT4296441.1 hypothetical protein [Candidatus Neomarinimicrobiota bacterium]